MPVKRLRIFAGPNGSGKSTIFRYIDSKIGCPYFVNADDIHKSLTENGVLNFDDYAITPDIEGFVETFRSSSWISHVAKAHDLIDSLRIESNRLYVAPDYVDGYFSAFVADYIRNNMLNIVHQFTVETVLSDIRKLEYIRLAKKLGYRIYLYFVSTKDVEINIRRVAQRVAQGGHDVPEDKVRKRYEKSLQNLFETIKLCDRAYLFDNSSEEWICLAEFDQDTLILHEDIVPAWLHENLLLKMHSCSQ